MAETTTDKNALAAELLPLVMDAMRKKTKNIFEVGEIADGEALESVRSFPALYSESGVRKQVTVPLSRIAAQAAQSAAGEYSQKRNRMIITVNV